MGSTGRGCKGVQGIHNIAFISWLAGSKIWKLVFIVIDYYSMGNDENCMLFGHEEVRINLNRNNSENTAVFRVR